MVDDGPSWFGGYWLTGVEDQNTITQLVWDKHPCMLRTKPPNDKLEIKVLDFGTWRKQNPRTRTTRKRSLTGIWNSFLLVPDKLMLTGIACGLVCHETLYHIFRIVTYPGLVFVNTTVPSWQVKSPQQANSEKPVFLKFEMEFCTFEQVVRFAMTRRIQK